MFTRRQRSTQRESDETHGTLKLMIEERAVLATLHRYGHSIDYGLEEDWLGCFTSDGAFDVRRRVRPETDRRYVGRAALAAFVAQHTRPPQRWHKHVLITPIIEIDGTTGTARSYFTRLDATDDGTPYVRSFGRYLDRLVKESDGVWRIAERIAEVEASAPEPGR